jgi:hypothetical protein
VNLGIIEISKITRATNPSMSIAPLESDEENNHLPQHFLNLRPFPQVQG